MQAWVAWRPKWRRLHQATLTVVPALMNVEKQNFMLASGLDQSSLSIPLEAFQNDKSEANKFWKNVLNKPRQSSSRIKLKPTGRNLLGNKYNFSEAAM